MADDLPLPAILRPRGSADASPRAEHRNHLVLNRNGPELPAAPSGPPEPQIDEAALTATAAEMKRRTADDLAGDLATLMPNP